MIYVDITRNTTAHTGTVGIFAGCWWKRRCVVVTMKFSVSDSIPREEFLPHLGYPIDPETCALVDNLTDILKHSIEGSGRKVKHPIIIEENYDEDASRLRYTVSANVEEE